MTDKILVVEDETDIRELVTYNLRQEGYEVYEADTGSRGMSLIKSEKMDLILLDIILPDLSGLEIIRLIKKNSSWSHIPTIIVSAKGEEVDRIVGLELGAEDYVVKPFSMRELILRVRTILDRTRWSHIKTFEDNKLETGPLAIDPARHEVWINDAPCVLTAKEFGLLYQLVSHPGKFQTREGLLEKVWGDETYVTSRTVDTHVRRLRKKLGAASDMIETMRGLGYRLRDSVKEEEAS